MKCPSCQFENPEDSTCCGKFGLPLEVICPNCGSKPPASFDFCNKCGCDLRKSKEAPALDYSEPQTFTPKHLALHSKRNEGLSHNPGMSKDRSPPA